MSGITSGIGLVSGLPTADLIDSLIAAQSRPKTLLAERMAGLQSQRSGLIELNARLVGLKGTTVRFTQPAFFNQFTATSSNESVLTARATQAASSGVIELAVRSLVSAHQLISRAFPDADATPVGVGRLTIEGGRGRLDRPTSLADLNGGRGVRGGVIEITDRAGNSARIDLRAALDVAEVVDLVNTATEINIRARVEGNHIVVEDLSGGTGALSIEDLSGGAAAEDLGLRKTVTADELIGGDIIYLSDSTLLANLNDGNGVRRNLQGADFRISTAGGASFIVSLVGTLDDTTRLEVLNNGNGVRLGVVRITNRLGATGTVDLSSARTIGDIRTLIEAAKDDGGTSLNIDVGTVAIDGVGSLSITDLSSVPADSDGQLVIVDISGFAARDLGIAVSTSKGSFVGSGIHRITTIGDVVRAINYAPGNDGAVVASMTASGIRLQDESQGLDSLNVEPLDDGQGGMSMAAVDLGIEGAHDGFVASRDLLAGLNTVLLRSLKGGSGLGTGQVAFTTRDGAEPVVVDFSGVQTVQDLIATINERVPNLHASVNAVGNGIAVTDETGAALGGLVIEDVSGTLAEDLGLAGSHARSRVDGSNVQLQYINETTALDTLNGGRGVRSGTIEFHTSVGGTFRVVVGGSTRTIGRVVDAIESAGTAFGIRASINDTGDGILITDTNGGSEALEIVDVDGAAATDLRIAGASAPGAPEIDGTFEIRIELDADDTLNDVAVKIREASSDLDATVINDGSPSRPYRLSMTSGVTGRRGELIFDGGEAGLAMSTLVEAQDAVVLIGGRGAANPIVVSSSTNTLTDVLPGVEIELAGVSDEPITVSTRRDIDRIVSDVNQFVTNYNAVMDRIDDLASFDPETQERGPLLGDSTVALVESRLARTVIGRFEGAPAGAATLASVGITFGNGGRLAFDESVFRERYADDPSAVEALFTAEEVGVGAVIDAALEELTGADGGVLARRGDALGQQVEDLSERITAFDEQLGRRREQLERQFANLETVLAGLQSQQDALARLASLATVRR